MLKFHSRILGVQNNLYRYFKAPIWCVYEVQFVGFTVLFIVNYDRLGQTEGTEVDSGHSLWLNPLFPFRLTGGIRHDER